MCGIAGYSLSSRSRVERTLAAQALLAGIAERGADAVGYAWRGRDARVHVTKQRAGASAILDQVDVPAAATQALIHVRDYTKGHPRIAANNHPIRHGHVVGIHNGIIVNDDAILGRHSCARAESGMTVDSEAIFALAAHHESRAEPLAALHGSLATAWLDERRANVVFVARGIGRPLWLGRGRDGVFFASTRHALEVLDRYLYLSLDKREVEEGTLLALEHGRVAWTERFSPDRTFSEEPLPAVRAPDEGVSCLQRLAALAAA